MDHGEGITKIRKKAEFHNNAFMYNMKVKLWSSSKNFQSCDVRWLIEQLYMENTGMIAEVYNYNHMKTLIG